jgi:hypothetical protein
MRHHEHLIAMRLAGRKPAHVYLETDGYAPEWALWPENDEADARIFVEPADVVERLDLRFLMGCQVHIDGRNGARVMALCGAAQGHGARRVVAHICTPIRDTFDVRIIDTEGLLSWPKC